MNVDMLPLEIVGLKKDLYPVVQALHSLGCVQIEDLAESPEISALPLSLDRETLRRQEELSFLAARIEGIMKALGDEGCAKVSYLQSDTMNEAREGVEELLPKIQDLTARRDKFQAKLASLPRYETTLRKLLPIIPPSAHESGNVTIGVLVSRSHVGVLDSISKRILDLTHGRAEVVASDVDASTRTMLIVFPQDFSSEIEAMLGQEDVSRLRLPAELGKRPPDIVLEKIHQWCDKLATWRDVLRDQTETNSVLSCFGKTDMTFVLMGWVPAEEFEKLKEALRQEIGEALFIQPLPVTPEIKKRAPVSL